jgi:hypothetical protein
MTYFYGICAALAFIVLKFAYCLAHDSLAASRVSPTGENDASDEDLVSTVIEQCNPSGGIRHLSRCRTVLLQRLESIDPSLINSRRAIALFSRFGRQYTGYTSSSGNSDYLSETTMQQFSYLDKSHLSISGAELILCVSHYQEYLGWLNDIQVPFIIASKTVVDPRILHVPVNRGNEVSSYLRYIIELYDHLPIRTLFLHGHDADWHQIYSVQYIVQTANLSAQYYNVNNYLVNDRNVTSNRYMQQLAALWPELFQDELGDMPSEFREKCCAQFIVHRDRIRLRSRAFYQRLYDYVVSDRQDDAAQVDGYHTSMSYVVEFVWHYIFGEPALMTYPNEPYVRLTDEIVVYL